MVSRLVHLHSTCSFFLVQLEPVVAVVENKGKEGEGAWCVTLRIGAQEALGSGGLVTAVKLAQTFMSVQY